MFCHDIRIIFQFWPMKTRKEQKKTGQSFAQIFHADGTFNLRQLENGWSLELYSVNIITKLWRYFIMIFPSDKRKGIMLMFLIVRAHWWGVGVDDWRRPFPNYIRAVHQNRNNAEKSAVQVVLFVQCTVGKTQRSWTQMERRKEEKQLQPNSITQLFSRQQTLPRLRAVHQNRNNAEESTVLLSFRTNTLITEHHFCSFFISSSMEKTEKSLEGWK